MAKKKTTEQYIIDFENKHGKGTYDYSQFVNNGAHKKSIIICLIHQKRFMMTPTNHLHRGGGCPDCAQESRIRLRTKTTEEYIIDFDNKHGKGRYDYSLFINNGSDKKSIIICPVHQKRFEMTPSDHVRGHGCKYCASDQRSLRQSKTTEHYIIDFENKHGKGRYDYRLFVNNGAKTKSIIICPIHNIQFEMSPDNHLHRGCGCPLCKEPKGEKAIRVWLTDNNIEFVTQHKPIKDNNRFAFDFWLPDYQLLLEFDGEQHYNPVKRFGGQLAFETGQLRDQQKTEWAISNNIRLLRIPYTEIKKIPEILKNNLTFII